jgi:protein SCO1/2
MFRLRSTDAGDPMKLMRRARTALGPRLILAAAVACAASCARGREYELRGQVLAVDRGRQEITVKHEDIRGFMPGMTMPFKVRDSSLLEQRTAGELIRATLVVEESTGYLKAIESIGRAPLTEPPPPPRRDTLAPGSPVPDVALVDASGRERSLAAWRNKAIGVTFTYTRCPIPDFCPAMDRRFAEVQTEIKRDPELRGRTHLLSISFDPAFDTPAVLAAHASKLGADPDVWSFLTGDQARIDEFAAAFGVQIMRDAAHTPEVVHNLRTAVIDGEGRLVTILNGNDWNARELVDALKAAGAKRTGSTRGSR